MKPAVFLDRDGTIIEHVHHLTDPNAVRLIPGAAQGIRSLREQGFLVVVVTNQSVIGRGLLDDAGLAAIHLVMSSMLAREGAAVDAIYYCPVAPPAKHPDRKPAPGMLLRAAAELAIALSDSWMVGDSISDVQAGRNAGCFGSILVRTGLGSGADLDDPAVEHVSSSLLHASRFIIESASVGAVAKGLK